MAIMSDAELRALLVASQAVLILDVVSLIRIDDEHGHRFGGEVLASLVAVLRERVPEGTTWRVGPDEVAVAVAEPPEDVASWARQVMASVEERLPRPPDGRRVRLQGLLMTADRVPEGLLGWFMPSPEETRRAVWWAWTAPGPGELAHVGPAPHPGPSW